MSNHPETAPSRPVLRCLALAVLAAVALPLAPALAQQAAEAATSRGADPGRGSGSSGEGATGAAAATPAARPQAGGAGAGGQGGGQGGGSRPTAAGYITAAKSDVPVSFVLTGRALAQNATQLRPRVGGTITEILYTPGTRVEAGTPLFAIDPLTYRVALAAAEADRSRAEADLRSAQTAFDRVSQLQGSAASRAAFDEAEAALLKAKASLGEAEANLDLARARLDWTTVRAPITGIVGVPQVAVGDLVTDSQSAPLAEIVQIDPIHVDLTEPYPTRLRIDRRAEEGEIALQEPVLTLVLDDGRRIEGRARLVSSAATVSTTTGTRLLRFEVTNPEGLIAPGMFLHGDLVVGRTSAFLIPQRATQRERDGTLTAWLEVAGKATKRALTESGTHGNAWVVQSGLEQGDRVLVDGTNNLREGQAIAPVPVEIDGMGVVRDADPAADPTAAPAPAPGN